MIWIAFGLCQVASVQIICSTILTYCKKDTNGQRGYR